MQTAIGGIASRSASRLTRQALAPGRVPAFVGATGVGFAGEPSRARTGQASPRRLVQAGSFHTRRFSTSPIHLAEASAQANATPAKPTGEAITLEYELHTPPSGAEPKAGAAKSLVVCHGLFGSKQNWRSLARGMAKKFGVPIYAVDLRNHGNSPHVAEGMTYYDMALDLIKFFKDHNLKDAALIGHSMGGKAVMSFALHPEMPSDALQYLVSVDMSPARGPLSKEFAQYVDAMAEIQEKGVQSRGEADEILQKTEPVREKTAGE